MDHDRDLEKRNLEVPEEEPEIDEEEEGWDGSEAELVADDDAAVYEDVLTGIRLNYTLRWREIYRCLKQVGAVKTTGARAIVETVLLAAAGAYSLYNWFLLHNVASLVLSILCLLLIVVVWVIPELGLRHQSRRMADGKEFALEVFPDAITVEHNGAEWEIPLDGEATDSAQYGNLLVLFHQKKMVILPLRCVEPAVLPEIQAMIVAGTNPRDDD